MTGRRRRAAALLGLALLLGGLAASDVARREAAVNARLGPLIEVVVAREDLLPRTRLGSGHLAVRQVPERFAPAGAPADPAELVGRRVAVPVPAGAYLSTGQLEAAGGPAGGAPAVRRGERAADVVGTGSPELVRPGARVDVLVTRASDEAGGGGTRLALEDVEVLAAARAPDAGGDDGGAPRVTATLRVTIRQAVYLAAAQSFAREVRFLPRAPGDRRRNGALAVGRSLG